MDWLVKDISTTMKSWGHTGGAGGHVIMKSDGEPAILAFKNAVMQLHGGVFVPEQPAKGEKAENGRIEEAGKLSGNSSAHFTHGLSAESTMRSRSTRISSHGLRGEPRCATQGIKSDRTV